MWMEVAVLIATGSMDISGSVSSEKAFLTSNPRDCSIGAGFAGFLDFNLKNLNKYFIA